jgi:membrane fusion protein (multidrug efflux system)
VRAQEADQAPAEQTVRVEAAKVVAAPLSEQVTAVGTLLSDESVTVSSESPGRLKEIHFTEGQPVQKGAPLFTLDESVYRAQLADAEAKLKLADQTNKRTSQLFSNKYATAQRHRSLPRLA